MFRLDDHTAIVTGGAGGIGAATVRALASCGANVVIADLNDEAGTELARAVVQAGTSALFVRTDVTDPDSVGAVVDAAVDRYGSLEILMHFAGIGLEKSALTTTLEDWNRVITTNLTASFLMMQAAAGAMVDRNYGRIVAMSSTAGLRGGTGRAAYGASKGGVIALASVMALEFAPFGITVNTLAPGAIETELVARMHDAETRRAYLQGIPRDRYGTPDEVAAAAVWFAMPEAEYVSGTVLPVDGGFTAAGVRKSLDRS